MTLQLLNQKFSINKHLELVEGVAGFQFINIQTALCDAKISLHGGQVLSFKPRHVSEDLLFVSDNAYYQTGKAIKGGCPICWPGFAQHPSYSQLPFHGFVRDQIWQLDSTALNEKGEIEIILSITDSDSTRSIWPYSFKLQQKIILGEQLLIELLSENTGKQSFDITQAIHTYFNIGDIQAISVKGLDKQRYLDKVENFSECTQQGDINFKNEVDRIYLDVSNHIIIDDPVYNRQINISNTNSHTTVVWNPWQKISQDSADLTNDAYQHFVCVETANAANEIVVIEPGESRCLSACYEIIQS